MDDGLGGSGRLSGGGGEKRRGRGASGEKVGDGELGGANWVREVYGQGAVGGLVDGGNRPRGFPEAGRRLEAERVSG